MLQFDAEDFGVFQRGRDTTKGINPVFAILLGGNHKTERRRQGRRRSAGSRSGIADPNGDIKREFASRSSHGAIDGGVLQEDFFFVAILGLFVGVAAAEDATDGGDHGGLANDELVGEQKAVDGAVFAVGLHGQRAFFQEGAVGISFQFDAGIAHDFGGCLLDGSQSF